VSAPARTAVLSVRGRAVRYRDQGEGTPVLMVHGIGRSLEDWTEQHDLLADGHRLISVDLAGFGESEPLREPHSLAALAGFCCDVLDALGVDEPAHVLGNSLGGAVAMQLAVLAPERVASLVLVNSAGFGREVTAALRILAIRPLAPLLLRRPSVGSARRVERSLFHDPAFVTEERVQLGLRLAGRAHGARVLVETARGLGGLRGVHPGWRERLLPAVAATGLPVLVVWGDRDTVLPHTHLAAARAAVPTAWTRLFPDTGHMPQVERAEEFAELVQEFWAAHPR
jgi:pimeloyl-ACP methyl ester carboxylesterase